MKIKVKVKEITKGCFPVRSGEGMSDCYDLFLAEDVVLKKGELGIFKLGVAMKLPKGMRATVWSRSSTPPKWSVQIANSAAIMDNTYSGDEDEWRVELLAFKAIIIPKGTRVCQFEVVPSQFATAWQKLKWLLSSTLLLEPVETLGASSRGGIGQTGE